MNAAKPVAQNVEQDQERKRKKRGAVIKFSLAGVALLGIGAAATSAAWTDDAWFSGSAQAVSSVQLQGATGATAPATDAGWSDAPSNSAVSVTTTAFGTLLPGDQPTVTLWLRNNGSTDLALAAPSIALTGTGILTTDASDTTKVAVSVSALPLTVLPAHQSESVTLKLAVPSGWAQTNAGSAAQSFTVSFTGSAQH